MVPALKVVSDAGDCRHAYHRDALQKGGGVPSPFWLTLSLCSGVCELCSGVGGVGVPLFRRLGSGVAHQDSLFRRLGGVAISELKTQVQALPRRALTFLGT